MSKDSIRNQVRNHPFDILVTNVALFYSCPENLSEVEFKDNKLIYFKEESCMKKFWTRKIEDNKAALTSGEINTIKENSDILN